MSYPIKSQLQGLPSYFGGKRRLLSWIGNTLTKACPLESWPNLTFIDLFMGGGSVSLWAKAQGFKSLVSNDISRRSQVIAEAFLKNDRVVLSPEDALSLTQTLLETPGWIESTYCPSVFSTRHARALDQGFYWANQQADPTKRALLLILMWHLLNEFVAFPTSIGISNRPFAEALDGLRGWDELNPKRFTDRTLKRLCEPTWARLEDKRKLINHGVMGGSPVQVFQKDALTLLPKLQGSILYLDPPYAGTLSYEKGNQILDTLLHGTPDFETPTVSTFSKTVDALEALFAKADHIPVWLLSYGGQELSLSELEELIRIHAGDRTVTGFARNYQHLSHVSKRENNQEYLIIATPNSKGAY